MSFVTRGGLALPPGNRATRRLDTRPLSPLASFDGKAWQSRMTQPGSAAGSTGASSSSSSTDSKVGAASSSTGLLDLLHPDDFLRPALSQIQETQNLLNHAIQAQAARSAADLLTLRELEEFDREAHIGPLDVPGWGSISGLSNTQRAVLEVLLRQSPGVSLGSGDIALQSGIGITQIGSALSGVRRRRDCKEFILFDDKKGYRIKRATPERGAV